MKKLYSIVIGLFLTVSAIAQAPQKMSYQAVIRKSNNALVASLPVGMKISILKGSSTGTPVYVETQTATTNANGLVSLEIGTGTAITGTFATINWANGPYFIKTETDPNGGTAYTIVGTNELMSVPYALFSANGTPGPQGPAGATGATGQQGLQGIQGLTGATGPTGLTGAQGPIGLTGAVGPQGPIGLTGATGAIGSTGLTGPAGPAGAIGAQGPIGLTGATGAVGAQGPQGLVGLTGAQGIQGLTGTTGPQGPIGLTGANGLAGTNGTNGISVTNSTVTGDSLFITLSSGQVLNAGYVKGNQGIQGLTGATGAQGIQGLSGTTGPQGPIGLTGATGPQGTFPNGTAAGQMMYWNGTAWVSVPPTNSLRGYQAKTLKFCNGKPTWEDCPAVLPTITTNPINEIRYDNYSNFYSSDERLASSGGSISDDGGSYIIEQGICWDTVSNPTVALSTKTIDYYGMANFISTINFTAGITYYVRAYATNGIGTSYGNEVVFTSLKLGESYQGGIVASLLQPGNPGYDANIEHGLIAAPSDQSAGIAWDTTLNYSIITNTYDGSANTNLIVSTLGNGNYAARLCYDLILNGFSDWYLPSVNEASKMNVYFGGYSNGFYWTSSTWNNGLTAFGYNFSNGYYNDISPLNTQYRVRAIRSF